MIKQALHGAPQDAKLLAYLSLCRPHVEFASSVWDPTLEYQINSIELPRYLRADAKQPSTTNRYWMQLPGQKPVPTARKMQN